MANPKYLEILWQGAAKWNAWRQEGMEKCNAWKESLWDDLREESPVMRRQPDLSEADLRWPDLSEANLCLMKLSGANLSGANLTEAVCFTADLHGADLGGANLKEAKLGRANLSGASLRATRMINANLVEATMTDACLWEAQRAGWSIKGVICESIYWDEERKDKTVYGPCEFERLFAGKTRIRLFYKDGINPLEIVTLPALIKHLEESHPGCSLRLVSIRDDAGGAVVELAVDDPGDQARWRFIEFFTATIRNKHTRQA